jgi:hypothetical protein
VLGVKAGLVASGFDTAPARPRAGRVLTARLGVKRLDTGAAVRSGTIRCAAQIAGRALRLAVTTLRGGRVICAWRIPTSARAKLVRGSVGLRQGSLRIERTFSKRIRG